MLAGAAVGLLALFSPDTSPVDDQLAVEAADSVPAEVPAVRDTEPLDSGNGVGQADGLGVPLAADDSDVSVGSPFRLTDVSPAEGSTTGGEAVVLTGSGFREGMMVRVEGRDAPQVEVLNDRKLRVVLPPGLPGDAAVEVGSAIDVPLVADGLFTYVERPPRVVMAIRPTLGSLAGGTAVTIVGTGFEPGARVVLGGERASDVEVIDSTRITATTPVHEPGIVDLVVRNPGMPAAVLAGAFEFVPGPTITGIDPIDIPESGGMTLTIWGTGFAPGMEVTLNGLPAFDIQVVDDTMLTATAPPGIPGPATLVVRNAGQPPATLLDAAFYFVPAPVEEATPSESQAPDGEVPLEDPTAPSPDVPLPVEPEQVPGAPAPEGATPAAG